MRHTLLSVLAGVAATSCMLAASYGYSVWRCSSPEGPWPIFGDFVVHCDWNHGLKKLRVFVSGTSEEPSNPITSVMLQRLAKPIALEAMQPIPYTVATGDIQVRVYGVIFPCKMVYARGGGAVTGPVRITSPQMKPPPKGEIPID